MQTTIDRSSTESMPDRSSLRIGGLCGIASGIIGLTANALHPRLAPEDLDSTEKTLEMVSGYSLWRVDHFAIVIAVILGLIAFYGIARSLEGTNGTWPRMALYAALASGGVALASFALDGAVLGAVAADWAAASGPAKARILERAETVLYVDRGLFAVTTFGLFGATQLLFGMALRSSTEYSKWVGWTALLGGLAGLVSGAWMWMSGALEVGNFLILFTLTSVLFVVWTFAASLRLLRLARSA